MRIEIFVVQNQLTTRSGFDARTRSQVRALAASGFTSTLSAPIVRRNRRVPMAPFRHTAAYTIVCPSRARRSAAIGNPKNAMRIGAPRRQPVVG